MTRIANATLLAAATCAVLAVSVGGCGSSPVPRGGGTSASDGSAATGDGDAAGDDDSATDPASIPPADDNSTVTPTVAPPSLPCMSCHSAAMGSRRAITDEFGLRSHHVQGTVTDTDCVVCHETTRHQQGQIRLYNVDDRAQLFVLTGDAMTTRAQATVLEAFCLACHDADGAGGAAPFSDGQMPPVIDAALWTAGTHAATQTTCVGDGETFGCHSTGHGSNKANLLAPWDASQPPLAGDLLREGEGMCYTCHDADGPAASDVRSRYVGTTHEVMLGGRSCTHCHDPHGSANVAALKGKYAVEDNTGYAADQYTACWFCHDENVVISQDNAFKKLHKLHVQGEKAPCSICHDVHAGFDVGEPGLLDMDAPIGRGYDISHLAGQDGSTSFWIEADGRGNCHIRCHGKDHTPKRYDRTPASNTDCSACH